MDEIKVVELSAGTLMMNSREHVRTGHRWVALSHDGGATWEGLHRDPALVDPGNNARIGVGPRDVSVVARVDQRRIPVQALPGGAPVVAEGDPAVAGAHVLTGIHHQRAVG